MQVRLIMPKPGGSDGTTLVNALFGDGPIPRGWVEIRLKSPSGGCVAFSEVPGLQPMPNRTGSPGGEVTNA